MQYLVIFSPMKKFESEGPPADFADVEKQEQAQCRVLYAQGAARQIWAKVPRTGGGVILFEAESEVHLHELINSFPLIKAGYAEPQVVPLQPHASFMPPETAS